MPRSVRRKSSTMDLSKLAGRQCAHPYNLRTRNRCTNYNEKHLSHTAMTGSQRRHQTSLKLPNTSTQSYIGSRSLHLNAAESPCSSNSLRHSRNILPNLDPLETTTLYLNEDFGKSTETSSVDEPEDEEDDVETEEDSESANTTEVEEDDAELSDTYRRNYSASAYSYQQLIGHSNGFLVTRSASQSAVRTEIDLADDLRDFDALATGDGGHNDPNMLEFSVTILDNNENLF